MQQALNEWKIRQDKPNHIYRSMLKAKEIYHLIYNLEVHMTCFSTNTIKGIVQYDLFGF